MSSQKYTPEFKYEAIKQVIDRGYSIAETAERLGVSQHSLYKWVNAAKPAPSEQQANELLEAKREVPKLRAQLRRAVEERDILKVVKLQCVIIIFLKLPHALNVGQGVVEGYAQRY